MNYLESSGSLMVLSAIATSLRLGYLAGPGWDEALERGWTHAREQFLSITAEGWVNVHKMCQVAGLGGATRRDGSFAYYMSEPIVTNDHKGYGPFCCLPPRWSAAAEPGPGLAVVRCSRVPPRGARASRPFHPSASRSVRPSASQFCPGPAAAAARGPVLSWSV